jgi:hypothetical protein
MISIVSLIYASPLYADAVFNSISRNTPLGKDCAFYFVANDPTEALLAHLKLRGYPYRLHLNPERPSEAELFERGIGAPAYLHGVYRAWNYAVESAPGDEVCLVNSDMMFSPRWLENLMKHLADDTIVCSQLVERNHPRHGVFPGAYERDFGSSPDKFDETSFQAFAARHRTISPDMVRRDGGYSPLLCRKRILLEAGGYPEGNLHDGTRFENIGEYGDAALIRKLAERGVRHITAMDSIVYHFKEGEMESCT